MLYEDITCVYRKIHVVIVYVILRLKIAKLSYIENTIFLSSLNISLIKENKWKNIGYNINYIKVFEWSSEDSSPYMN
jgi:hypothetical protein